MTAPAGSRSTSDIESPYAWLRLVTAMLLATIGGVGMWSVVVALPAIQADFGVDRADAALPYTLAMLGFGGGGVLMGRLSDRFGIVAPLGLGALSLGLGYLAVGQASSLWHVAAAHTLIGLGSSASFGPLMADVSHWFDRRRGIAVSLAASGNYIAGTIWPTVIQHFIASDGWRATHSGIGLFCLATMLPLLLLMRRRIGAHHIATGTAVAQRAEAPVSPTALQVLLCIAGVACCVAMSMPQVHLVAYCGDLGYGPARGAEMLSLMLGLGIISRIASGFIADRVGGVRTLLLGSVLQGTALLLYLMFDGLMSLYVISGLFGLFQGGIVPSYTIIVREYFVPREAGTRVGLVLLATLLGMALGGWMSGAIFDLTGSYQTAFLNGLGWNLLNVCIMTWLLLRSHRRPRLAPAAEGRRNQTSHYPRLNLFADSIFRPFESAKYVLQNPRYLLSRTGLPTIRLAGQGARGAMQFTPSRADVVRAINQRWLLKFWQHHLGENRVPQWQAVEAENLSNIADQLSFLDVIRGNGGIRFMIRFHGTTVGEVYGSSDCRGKCLDEIVPNPDQSHVPYLQAVQSGRPVYTIQDVTDRDRRTVHYERLLLPFSRDGSTVDRILASFEYVCAEGAFNRRSLMVSQTTPPRLRLSAMIEPRALA